MNNQIDFDHLNRMQRRMMARESWVTREEFEAEPEKDRVEYYRWMSAQCGELADLI